MAYSYRRPIKRRLYVRRRRRYTGGMRTAARGNRYSGQLSVYRNAFSTATTNPKIPDGKAYHSSGVRLQAVKEWVNDTNSTIDFLLFPGLNNGLIMANANQTNGRNMPYPSHGVYTIDGTNAIQNPETAIDKWRIVSQALKITLINNSDENDGWWEACRVQISSNESLLLQQEATGVIVGTDLPATALPAVDVTRQMVENPTYVTGKLRDIHRHIFQLAPQGSDHDFNELRRNINLTADQTELVDRNFDAIYIRIHGRTGAETPTRVMTHVVSNQEVVYDEGATLCRYHSEGGHSTLFDSTKRAVIAMSPKAAKRMKYSTS